MKQLELSQEDIDVLWSAVINQESVENVLLNCAKDTESYMKHCRQGKLCEELRERIRELGVTGLNN